MDAQDLSDKIEWEGLHYALLEYFSIETLAEFDKKLGTLVQELRDKQDEVENHLEQLGVII